MVGRLEGKNAIITGAAGGVGLESTILFLQQGASVLMTDINNAALERALNKVKSVVPDPTGRVEIKVVDVSKEEQVEAAVTHLDAWGGVDVVFNNAGIMHPRMATRRSGVWYGSKHAVRSLRKHGKTKGSIINTASMVAIVGAATPQVAYTASKGAVLAYTREMAIVHAREGKLPLQLTLPCTTQHTMLQEFLGDDKAKRFRREVHFPTGRFGEAIEQAQAAVFLASDESSFVNAHDFVVDGGLTKAYVTPEGPATQAPRNQG
ncbi:putative oxidoreductase yxbG [Fusarium oxysporum]|nr:putative oxidoreductase yxbG [Fusarium oxysporum]